MKNTFINETEELAHVFVDDEEIVCTPGHKFYAPEKGWTSAIKLRAGDHLQLVNGEYVTVEKVQHELLEEPVKVYNFEVEDFHTYYVGFGNQVLVHNKCSTDTPLTWNEFQHVNKGKYTKQEMSEAWAKYKELNYPKTVVKNTADSTVLRKNMIKDGIQVPEYKNDAHHIVAGNAEGANEARAILEKYGVGINDSANGVFLPSQESMSEAAYLFTQSPSPFPMKC